MFIKLCAPAREERGGTGTTRQGGGALRRGVRGEGCWSASAPLCQSLQDQSLNLEPQFPLWFSPSPTVSWDFQSQTLWWPTWPWSSLLMPNANAPRAVNICYKCCRFYFFFLSVLWDMWHLSSLSMDRTRTPCLGSVESNYWAAREVPCWFYFCHSSHRKPILKTFLFPHTGVSEYRFWIPLYKHYMFL